VNIDNLKAAMGVTKWTAYAPFFQMLAESESRSSASTSEDGKIASFTVNVFVFGGSMTAGLGLGYHCFCNNSFSERVQNYDCTWKNYLVQWLVQEYPSILFRPVFLAFSGHTTASSIDEFGQYLLEPFYLLTAHDLYLLDHSVNDVAQFTHAHDVAYSVEILLRRIYKAYIAALLAAPTVILIEQFAHHAVDVRSTTPRNTTIGYITPYREVAERYDVLVLSMREVYWQYEDVVSTPTGPARLYPLDVRGAEHIARHPHWPTHVFMADILAGSFKDIVDAPGKHVSVAGAQHVYELPDSKLGHQMYLCDINTPLLVNRQATSSFHPTDIYKYEQIEAGKGEEGWREYVDYHTIPGWIINNRAKPDHFNFISSFTFTQTQALAEDFALNYLVKLTYLKSYIGMGGVEVLLCGSALLTVDRRRYIDALDVDNHISVPVTAVFRITPEVAAVCFKSYAAAHEVIVRYIPDINDFVTLKSKERGQNKFKVMGVHICKEGSF